MQRKCDQLWIKELSQEELKSGMDFRKIECRRAVFLCLYEFNLKFRAHAGGVYQFIPYLSELFKWNIEERLWFATLNGMTQYAMSTLEIFKHIPVPPFTDDKFAEFDKWFNESWAKLPVDADRKWQKRDIPKAVKIANERVKEYGSLLAFYTGDFKTIWNRMRTELYSLGRLGVWSGMEFCKIAGNLEIEYDSLMLRDMEGSKSHRNGLCRILGLDNLDWHKQSNPDFNGKYTEEELLFLEKEGEILLKDAKQRFADRDFIKDVGYQTLETALCNFKSSFRKSRRYVSVYNDMAYGRLIEISIKNPSLDLKPFYDAREFYLPDSLRIECNPAHPQFNSTSLSKWHQNLYRETGQIPNLEVLYDCFKIT